MGVIGFYFIGPRLDQVPAFRSTKIQADNPNQPDLATSSGYIDLGTPKTEDPEFQDLNIKIEEPGTTKKKEKEQKNENEKPSDKLNSESSNPSDSIEPEEEIIPDTPPVTEGDAGW